MFADDVTLLATTPNDLQNQLDCLKLCYERRKIYVNKASITIVVFRKGDYLSQSENGILMILVLKL